MNRLRVLGILAAGLLAAAATAASAESVLFVGNSFTFGARSPVMRFRPDKVTDLNGEGIGGVPALFRTFAEEAGLTEDVSLETSPGKPLSWHLANRRAVIDRAWDVVILQGYSTLDPAKPGDPAAHIQAAAELARIFKAANPKVKVYLESTWSRADQTFRPEGHWAGRPIEAMAQDLAAASAQALKASPDLTAAIPVGTAWTRAVHAGVADPNPYDGIDFGKVSLWTWDQYHASAEGYYLAALVIFGQVTGVDPLSLGAQEQAAVDLGLSPAIAQGLRQAAHDELAAR
ncbi:DUF4886 domain-containing protein [Phenylobacterium sp.]|uniref:DUF4886 domain-containing protein n=1 Tax=Phenylobacterium sp. TaxID=1871053 RepID=UPI0025DB0D4E|nr:DUF4886 domain-containing protein [Phenylobacterium sp.]